MSTTAVIAIVIAVVVVLAAVCVLHAGPPQRRPRCRRVVERNGQARPSARATPRCRWPARPPHPTSRPRALPTAHQHRARHDRSRHGHRSVDTAGPRGDRRVAPAVLQPGHGRADEHRHRHVRRRGVRRLPVADRQGRLRWAGHRRQAARHQGRHQAGQRVLLRTRGPCLDHRVSGRGAAGGRDSSTTRHCSSRCAKGITILSQKCPHLGCRVPQCATSQWFECQCHGSQYNRVGEKKAGPAPRGMDRYPATIAAER